MTVSTTLNKQVFPGNAAQTVFNFSFAFPFGNATQEAANIQVFYTSPTGVITQLVQGLTSSNYQITFNSPISPNPTPAGGQVTYNPPGGPIPFNSTLTVIRTMPLTQGFSFANQANTYQPVFEQGIDYQTMLNQQILEVQNRAIVVAISDPVPNPLPPAAQRAGLLLGFDANGNPIATSGSGGAGGGVTSWNGRSGTVLPATNDYAFSQLSGSIAVNQMNSGTGAGSTVFWRGDGIWNAVSFTNLSGNIAVGQMNSGASASPTTFWRGDGAWSSSLGAVGAGSGSLTLLGTTSGSSQIFVGPLGSLTMLSGSTGGIAFQGTAGAGCTVNVGGVGVGTGSISIAGNTSGNATLTTPATGGVLEVSGALATNNAAGLQTVNAATATITSGLVTVTIAAGSTLTLPTGVTGQHIWLRAGVTLTGPVISASANIVPLNSTTPGTTIIATAGKFAHLVFDGTNWQVMEQV